MNMLVLTASWGRKKTMAMNHHEIPKPPPHEKADLNKTFLRDRGIMVANNTLIRPSFLAVWQQGELLDCHEIKPGNLSTQHVKLPFEALPSLLYCMVSSQDGQLNS